MARRASSPEQDWTVEEAPPLRTIRLLRERVPPGAGYPFTVPAIASLKTLEFNRRVCFFVGENGTGKSTLIEAIADHFGLGREGGSKNFRTDTTSANAAATPLSGALRLSWAKKLLFGYFLRAESFFNVASFLDTEPELLAGYGGQSLHRQSHGESFLALLRNRLRPGGFYLMDEPEAALSPQRQLTLLVRMKQLLSASPDTQFLIATHSPVLLAYPGAQIVSFDGGEVGDIRYEDSAAYQVVRAIVEDRAGFLRRVLEPESG